MQTGCPKKNGPTPARAPVSLFLGGSVLLAMAFTATLSLPEPPPTAPPTLAPPLSFALIPGGQLLPGLFTYPFTHSTLWHAALSLLGICGVGRSVELMIGGRHLLAATLIGTLAGAGTHLLSDASGALPANTPLEGGLPLVSVLIGMYSTILPGWRIGAASRWMRIPLKAASAGWATALLCALWWFSGAFPQGGPASSLAGLLTGWAYARLLGFGDLLFHQRALSEGSALENRIQGMDWEEFLTRELNPVLEKISKQGLRSLTRGERRILRHSRRKLEGW